MKARGLLMVEHRLIEKMLLLAWTRIEPMDELTFDPWFVDQVVDFIRFYADRTHHGKEEGILFRKLATKALVPRDEAMMRELLDEHQQARDQVGRLVVLNGQFRRGDKSVVKTIAENIRWFCTFYPAHIKKEDSEFFPDADQYFSEKELEDNLAESIAFDARMIHEKYQDLFETLSQEPR
jgi:hemerythrin-like domain-containing protein